MNRLTMLKKAREIAYEQIDMSSALSEKQYAELSELPEEEALYTLAYKFLDNAHYDIEDTLDEIKEAEE